MIGLVAVLVILVLGGFILSQRGGSQIVPTPTTQVQFTPQASSSAAPGSPAATSAATTSTSGVKTIAVTGKNYAFDPSTISVNKGDQVTINFSNTGGFHDWTLEGYNVKTQQIGSGKQDTVTFTADKVGTFKYYCSVDGHRGLGMEGTLTVK